METDETLIAASLPDSDAVFVIKDASTYVRRKATEIPDDLMSSVAAFIKEKWTVDKLKQNGISLDYNNNGEKIYVELSLIETPEPGIHWILVIAVSESDFLGKIYEANKQVLLC